MIDLVLSISLEILIQEHPVFQREIVTYKCQRLIAIADHHVGIFTDNVNLLHFHLVEIIQFFIIINLILYQIALFNSMYF